MDNAVPFPFRKQSTTASVGSPNSVAPRPNSRHIPSSLDYRHLHTKADSKIRDLSLRANFGYDLAFSTALAGRAPKYRERLQVAETCHRPQNSETQPFEVHLHCWLARRGSGPSQGLIGIQEAGIFADHGNGDLSFGATARFTISRQGNRSGLGGAFRLKYLPT